MSNNQEREIEPIIGSFLKYFIPSFVIKQKLAVKRCILFTFDDGPHPEVTPRVLDLLDRYGARGLFFIPGNRIGEAPELLNEIIDRKHGIGNHSFTHTINSSLSFQEMIREIKNCRDEIKALTGVVTRLYRPPMGKLSPTVVAASITCKHEIIRWSFDIGDYSYLQNASSSELAANFLDQIHDRAIVLSHDDNETVPGFLEIVLPKLLDRGFNLKIGLHSLGWDFGD